jgi:hypothetical protein
MSYFYGIVTHMLSFWDSLIVASAWLRIVIYYCPKICKMGNKIPDNAVLSKCNAGRAGFMNDDDRIYLPKGIVVIMMSIFISIEK